jgi:hypothetical protein
MWTIYKTRHGYSIVTHLIWAKEMWNRGGAKWMLIFDTWEKRQKKKIDAFFSNYFAWVTSLMHECSNDACKSMNNDSHTEQNVYKARVN